MTVQDLLRHTAGLTYGNRGTSLVHKAYIDAKIGDRTATNEEMVKRLCGVPLLFSPGERWEYSVAVDVQGRLIEVLTGKKLSEAFDERVFEPARHGRHLLPGAGRQARARRAARPEAQRPADDAALQGRRWRQVRIGRRRSFGHDRGLPALQPGAGQWRRLPGQAHHRPQDAGVHDRRPRRRPAGPAGTASASGWASRSTPSSAAIPR